MIGSICTYTLLQNKPFCQAFDFNKKAWYNKIMSESHPNLNNTEHEVSADEPQTFITKEHNDFRQQYESQAHIDSEIVALENLALKLNKMIEELRSKLYDLKLKSKKFELEIIDLKIAMNNLKYKSIDRSQVESLIKDSSQISSLEEQVKRIEEESIKLSNGFLSRILELNKGEIAKNTQVIEILNNDINKLIESIKTNFEVEFKEQKAVESLALQVKINNKKFQIEQVEKEYDDTLASSPLVENKGFRSMHISTKKLDLIKSKIESLKAN